MLILSLAYYPKHVGGAEVAIKEITDRIDPDDIEFHMVCLRFDRTLPRRERVGNVVVHRIGFTRPDPRPADLRKMPLHLNKFLFQYLAFAKARALHRTLRFDALWGMMAHATAIPAGLFKRAYPSVGYALTLQEGDPPEHIERAMRPVWPLFSRGVRSADAVQVISSFLGAWARRLGVAHEPVLIPNGVDIARFARTIAPATLEATRREMGRREGEVWLVHTGRLVRKNGVDNIIRALSLLPPRVRFLQIGIGEEEAALKALAAAQGVAHRICWKGWVDHGELPRYLKASDIFVRPSRSEGMGNSFIEAMAAGLPAIGTQEGGIADFLFDARKNPDKKPTGWAVGKESPQEIAAAVQHIISNPEEARAVCAHARDMVRERYSWDLVARRMREEVFGNVLGERGGG